MCTQLHMALQHEGGSQGPRLILTTQCAPCSVGRGGPGPATCKGTARRLKHGVVYAHQHMCTQPTIICALSQPRWHSLCTLVYPSIPTPCSHFPAVCCRRRRITLGSSTPCQRVMWYQLTGGAMAKRFHKYEWDPPRPPAPCTSPVGSAEASGRASFTRKLPAHETDVGADRGWL